MLPVTIVHISRRVISRLPIALRPRLVSALMAETNSLGREGLEKLENLATANFKVDRDRSRIVAQQELHTVTLLRPATGRLISVDCLTVWTRCSPKLCPTFNARKPGETYLNAAVSVLYPRSFPRSPPLPDHASVRSVTRAHRCCQCPQLIDGVHSSASREDLSREARPCWLRSQGTKEPHDSDSNHRRGHVAIPTPRHQRRFSAP